MPHASFSDSNPCTPLEWALLHDFSTPIQSIPTLWALVTLSCNLRVSARKCVVQAPSLMVCKASLCNQLRELGPDGGEKWASCDTGLNCRRGTAPSQTTRSSRAEMLWDIRVGAGGSCQGECAKALESVRSGALRVIQLGSNLSTNELTSAVSNR